MTRSLLGSVNIYQKLGLIKGGAVRIQIFLELFSITCRPQPFQAQRTNFHQIFG